MAGATILTDGLIEEISGYIEDGNYINISVALSGVSKVAFYNWIKKGKAAAKQLELDEHANLSLSQKLYIKLVDRVDEANATAEKKRVKTIIDAAKDDPKWAAWFLERRFGERWSNRQSFDITTKGDIEQNVKFDFTELTDEDIEYFLTLIRRVMDVESIDGESSESRRSDN